jgi:hypothetical protein
VLRLLTGAAPGKTPTPLGLSGDTLYYTTDANNKRGDLHRLHIDGTGDALLAPDVYPALGTLRTTGRADFTQFFFGAPTSLFFCSALAGAADCRGGTLKQIDLGNQAITALGNFAANSAPVWSVSALGRDGRAGSVVTAVGAATAGQSGYDRTDMWLVNPGEANSLRRVTATMP